MKLKKIVVFFTVIILIIVGVLIAFSIKKIKVKKELQINEELEELRGISKKVVFEKPTYYSKNAIIKYIKWKYGEECRFDSVKKESDGYTYKFVRNNRNDYFYIIAQTTCGIKRSRRTEYFQIKLNGLEK